MATYRKKPVEVKAVPVREAHHAAADDWRSLPDWLRDAYERRHVLFLNRPACVRLETLNGWVTAELNEWIVCGIEGEIYPCKPEIFAASYEPVTAPNNATD